MARTVLVTGGTGTFVAALVRLDAAGADVRILSLRQRPDNAAPEIEWVTGELTTGDGMADACASVEVIVRAETTLFGRKTWR